MPQALAKADLHYTTEEYLRNEREAEERHEYWQGEVFNMTGASRRHNLLTGNAFGALRNHLRGKPCRPYVADLRVQLHVRDHYVYPDVVVVCEQAAFVEEDLASDATLVIEVLSSSTESRDRGAKFLGYQNLPSFQEYVLVSHEAMRVEVFRKEQSGHWHYEVLQGPEAVLNLESVGYSGTLREWYEDTGLLEEAA